MLAEIEVHKCIFNVLQSDEENGMEKEGEDSQQKFIAHVPVPSQQEVRNKENIKDYR